MKRLSAIILVLSLLVMVWQVDPVRAQEGAGSGASAKSTDLDQIQWCREGVLDPNAKPELRRRWACRLLQMSTAESKAVFAGLLAKVDAPDTQRALADAIVECGRGDRTRLDDAFLSPLVELLGHAQPELRAASARALAEFPGQVVLPRIEPITMQESVPGKPDPALPRRLAAIDVLASNVHRREVVQHLLKLIDLGIPEVTNRVMGALQSASRSGCGDDVACWKRWGEEIAATDETSWSTQQLQLYRDRALATQSELDSVRESTRRHDTAVAARITDFLRAEFRQIPSDQTDAKLMDWLRDPLPEVGLGAVELIKARLSDEGKRPAGPLLALLIQLLKDGPTPLRREVVLIVQNLNEPTVVEALLARAEAEEDSGIRASILRALGKLGSAEAVSVLVRELMNKSSATECVREAAIALGQIASRTEAAPKITEAIGPLKMRYQNVGAGETQVRAALLTAMAGMADASFLPEFSEAIGSEDPGVIRAALRGLRALNDVSHLSRMRALVSDRDPLVRQAAIEALAYLSRDDADFESLLPRLKAGVESNEMVRQAAWSAFLTWQRRKPIPERVKAADRLRDVPDGEIRYLEQLAIELGAIESARGDVESIRDRLAATLVSQNKHAASVPHLRELYAVRSARSESEGAEAGARWLEAVLRSFNQSELTELLRLLFGNAPNDEARDRLILIITQFLDSPECADADRVRKLFSELRPVSADDLGERWMMLMRRVTERVQTGTNSVGKVPQPSP